MRRYPATGLNDAEFLALNTIMIQVELPKKVIGFGIGFE